MNKSQAFPFAFFRGEVVPTESAQVSIMTNALQYGTAWFGGIRGYNNPRNKTVNIFRLDDHIRRFMSSAQIIGVDLKYTESQLRQIMLDLVKRNKPETDIYLRPFAYASSTQLAPNLNRENPFDFALYMIPLGDYLPTDKGLRTGVSSWKRVTDNMIPPRAKISGAYINSALARKEADDHGYDEAIFLTQEGYVCEGSAENIFLVKDGVLVTPSTDSDILEGITRRTVIKMARDAGIPVVERIVKRTELYTADELFFSGTGVQIAWISEVDRRTIGSGTIGPVTEKLQKQFFRIVKGEVAKYKRWNTPISYDKNKK